MKGPTGLAAATVKSPSRVVAASGQLARKKARKGKGGSSGTGMGYGSNV